MGIERYFANKQYVFEIWNEYDRCLMLSPQIYYEEEKCVWDSGYPKEIIDFLKSSLKAYEVCDSTFEFPENITDEQVVEILSKCQVGNFKQIVFFPTM